MADTITITLPAAGSTVARSFGASGSSSYNPATGPNTTIAVKLLDAAGNLISVSGNNPVIIPVPNLSTLFPWFAFFAASAGSSNCSVTAQIFVNGTAGPANTVTNIT